MIDRLIGLFRKRLTSVTAAKGERTKQHFD